MTQENTSYEDGMNMSEAQQEDAPYFANFAMIRNSDDIVQDILTCLNTFKMNGYYFVEIKEGMMCAAGMRYNSLTGTFANVETEEESTSTGETTTS